MEVGPVTTKVVGVTGFCIVLPAILFFVYSCILYLVVLPLEIRGVDKKLPFGSTPAIPQAGGLVLFIYLSSISRTAKVFENQNWLP